ncbi:MAG: polyprenyl synthetase family protein [Clostridia bacterium]|nr:polyprenyl synthetase family protein [Clostridia bacterium]
MVDSLLKEYQAKLDSRFDILLTENGQLYDEVIKACRYAVLNGGKRIRPTLLLEFYKLCGREDDCAYNFACALEMIHSYSLVHDDLPCMDNDDMRRGKPSCHKAFGESTALLCGDALLTEAFLVASKTLTIPADRVVKALSHLAASAGVAGMIGGQVIDMADNSEADDDVLFEMYRLKTGALLKTACAIGCILAGADDELVAIAEKFGEKVGVAFQIIDDILDSVGDAKTLGKPVGSDEKNNKDTIAVRLGVEYCRELAQKYTDEAFECLEHFDGDTSNLKNLAAYLLKRDY